MDLYRGRISLPQTQYFLTLCTAGRKQGLTNLPATQLFSGMEDLEQSGDLQNYCATVMPDHIHWLFQLGERLTLGRAVAKWKADTRKMLANNGLEWQRDFFERRVRKEERLEVYGLYIFLNPYRKKLLAPNAIWPHWRAWQPMAFEFCGKMLKGNLPQQEWLEQEQSPPWTANQRAQQDCAPTAP